jgi:hypothetical protein
VYGAAFVFDLETETTMRRLWQSIAGASLPSFMLGVDYPPHMSVFGAEEVDLSGLRAALAGLAGITAPLPVSFPALGHILGGGAVAYLAPAVNRPLLDLHAAFWEAARPYARGMPSIAAPGAWLPHVTLAFNTPPDQVGPVAAILAKSRPLSGTISGLLFGDWIIEGGSKLERFEFTGDLFPDT